MPWKGSAKTSAVRKFWLVVKVSVPEMRWCDEMPQLSHVDVAAQRLASKS